MLDQAFLEALVSDATVSSIDELKERLRPLCHNLQLTGKRLPAGELFYFASLTDRPNTLIDAGFPFDDVNGKGRANREGSGIAYFATTKRASLGLRRPVVGSKATIIQVRTTKPLTIIHLGYPQEVVAQDEFGQFIDRAFLERDSSEGTNLSVAIAELVLEAPIGGISYPYLTTGEEVIAIKPESVDAFEFVMAETFRISEVLADGWQTAQYDHAPQIDGKDSRILWYGLNRKRRYGTFGWEEFLQQKRQMLSAYDDAKRSNANRPVRTEHGNVAQAVFREWLTNSLPKKFGVTSGFVFPDVRRISYVNYEYDVIVYDAINAPVLFASTGINETEAGRRRAIPAEYVRAVFEIKATLNPTSIDEAKKKLRQLQDCQHNLPRSFSSSFVFFEVTEAHQRSCRIAEHLFDVDIPGYFGGIILRAETIDEHVSAYFEVLPQSDHATEADMPLVRALSQFDEIRGRVKLKGDSVYATAFDGIWHIDLGYQPIVKNIRMKWAYNSFPSYYFDLLTRLEGKFDPRGTHAGYGLSFNP